MEKKIVTIRNMQIGAGKPKICIPLVAANKEELSAALERADKSPYDLVEWRADFYNAVDNAKVCREALGMIRDKIGEKPLLFTFRTAAEGGNRAIEDEDYFALNAMAAGSGLADIVDVEIARKEELVRRTISFIHEQNVVILGSNHDFEKTPPAEEIVRRLIHMQELGADITKIAVMPQKKQDVLDLIRAAVQMEEVYGDRPCVTMSMGKTGVISRICGSFSGSSITFGMAGTASAPGQIPAEDLAQILRILSQSIG